MNPQLTRRHAARLAGLLLSAGLGLAACPAFATRYPDRPVKVILPFPAGTVTDNVTRVVTERMAQRLGQSFVVENRPGGSGSIGAAHVARATADGYTILFTTNTTHSVIASLLKKVPYDPQRDFTPVAKVAGLPSMVIAGPALTASSIQELVKHVQANPGKLRYGFGNSSGQIGGENLRRAIGAEMVAVPYKGNPQGVQDLLGGHLDAMVVDITTGLGAVRSGKAKALAVLTNERMDILPEVPTLNEVLGPGNDAVAWFGLLGPAGLPADVVETLAREVKAALEDPAVAARLKSVGVLPDYLAPAAFRPFLASELVRWTTLARDAGISPE
jgi:tripartite-type tricarboxylate transporter receptor subunit TctC